MSSAANQEFLVYLGTSGAGERDGIYIYRFQTQAAALEPVDVVLGIHNPSFLAIHPNRRYLYAIDEGGSERPEAKVRAFAIDPASGRLTPINHAATGGQGLCHVIVDRTGRFVLAVHYSGGSVCVLPVRPDGGVDPPSDVVQHEGSSVHPRQRSAHPHAIQLDPAGRFAFVPDLGMDKIMIYRLTGDGKLAANETPWAEVAPGAGPRHFAFHPGGRWAYVINELGSTVTAFNYDSQRGALVEFQTITTLPDGFTGENYTAEIAVHPSGRFLYGSNRGHDSIAIFAVDAGTGRLSPLGHEPTQGGHPRHFALDPTGTFLLAQNRDSDNVVLFRIDREAGLLHPTGHVTRVPRPVCIQMMPAPWQ